MAYRGTVTAIKPFGPILIRKAGGGLFTVSSSDISLEGLSVGSPVTVEKIKKSPPKIIKFQVALPPAKAFDAILGNRHIQAINKRYEAAAKEFITRHPPPPIVKEVDLKAFLEFFRFQAEHPVNETARALAKDIVKPFLEDATDREKFSDPYQRINLASHAWKINTNFFTRYDEILSHHDALLPELQKQITQRPYDSFLPLKSAWDPIRIALVDATDKYVIAALRMAGEELDYSELEFVETALKDRSDSFSSGAFQGLRRLLAPPT